MIAYFDASAFVKLLVDEDGSDLADELWDHADAVVASRLAYPEVRAALAAAGRDHRLSPGQARAAEADWSRFWDAVRPIELTAPIGLDAGHLAGAHRLGGADSVHLASARAVGADVVLATWDRRLAAGAAAAGLLVAPATGPAR